MSKCIHNWDYPTECPMCRADRQTEAARFRMEEARQECDEKKARQDQLDRIEDKLDRLLRVMR